MDAFVTKLKPDGTAFVYSTYLGGTNTDTGQAITVDSAGSAYVTGSTSSANFPLSATVQSLYGGNSDAFITKVNPVGDNLTYSTYLGGIGQDHATGIAIDANHNAYITGSTTGSFPLSNAMQSTYGGGTSDAFRPLAAKTEMSSNPSRQGMRTGANVIGMLSGWSETMAGRPFRMADSGAETVTEAVTNAAS